MSAPMKIEQAWLDALDDVGVLSGPCKRAFLSAVAPLIRAAALEEAADTKRVDFLQTHVSAIRDIGWLHGDLRAAIDAAIRALAAPKGE